MVENKQSKYCNDKGHILFCILGRTGAGKSVVTNAVANELDLKILQSYTTRDARENEIENIHNDHIFISAEDFKALGELVAYTKINNNEYGCTYEQLLDADFYVIDPIGLEYLKQKKLDDIDIVAIYITAPEEVRMNRYVQRGKTTIQDFRLRDEDEREQFDKFENEQLLNFIKGNKIHTVVNNGCLTKAVEDMKEIVGSYLDGTVDF